MKDTEKELEEILNDPLFDNVTAPKRRITRSEKIINGFLDICAFYKKNWRRPEDCDEQEEKKLFHMLKGIMENEEKRELCRPVDRFGLLDKAAESNEDALESVLNDPLFDSVTAGSNGIFDIPEYMTKRLAARKEAGYIGKRRPCEDFERFAAGFRDIHAGLNTGRYRLVKFSAVNLKVGSYFVEDGIIGYLAAFDYEGKTTKGSADGRTRVIYENGAEADIKYQTIVKNLAVDGCSVQDMADVSTEELQKHFSVDANDVESGTIYVLRSKSKNPEIATIKDLYKIGFTTTSVESRIAGAATEPTYLCAAVEVVAAWKVYNVKASTFEALIHKLFSGVQLQVEVDGRKPKEWFVVPLPVIKQAIEYIIGGISVTYDSRLQTLVTAEKAV